MQKKTIRDVDSTGKRVLMRVDFNVPLDDSGAIRDDSRILAALPTVRYCLEQKAGLILMSHLGRPKGHVQETMKLTPVARRLGESLGKEVRKLDDCIGPDVENAVRALNPGDIILLENLRFHKEETENDPSFAQKLASLGEVFVNDAFGTCHRAHASTEGVTHYLESVAGFLVEKEIEYFEKVSKTPDRPFALVLGGAKVADKIPLITHMLPKIDMLFIGGAMAYTFLKQQGIAIGSSRYEPEMAEVAGSCMKQAQELDVEVILPLDHIICDRIDRPNHIQTTEDAHIPDGFLGVDIGPQTIDLFGSKLQYAHTIVWNGPMGIFERDEFLTGTREIAEVIASSSGTTIIGGGDSAAAVKQCGVEGRISHISTGGGASLEYLEGKILPGIAALADK